MVEACVVVVVKYRRACRAHWLPLWWGPQRFHSIQLNEHVRFRFRRKQTTLALVRLNE